MAEWRPMFLRWWRPVRSLHSLCTRSSETSTIWRYGNYWTTWSYRQSCINPCISNYSDSVFAITQPCPVTQNKAYTHSHCLFLALLSSSGSRLFLLNCSFLWNLHSLDLSAPSPSLPHGTPAVDTALNSCLHCRSPLLRTSTALEDI